MSVVTVLNPATEEAVTTVEHATAERGRCRDRAGGGRVRRPGARCRPATGPGCCAGSPPLVDAHLEELAGLEVAQHRAHGLRNARWEAGNVRDVLLYYSAAPERLSGRQIPVPGGLNVTFHEPLGVVGLIVPWNFPMPIAVLGLRPGARRRQHRRGSSRPRRPR